MYAATAAQSSHKGCDDAVEDPGGACSYTLTNHQPPTRPSDRQVQQASKQASKQAPNPSTQPTDQSRKQAIKQLNPSIQSTNQ